MRSIDLVRAFELGRDARSTARSARAALRQGNKPEAERLEAEARRLHGWHVAILNRSTKRRSACTR